jgi:hypothetical protein
MALLVLTLLLLYLALGASVLDLAGVIGPVP